MAYTGNEQLWRRFYKELPQYLQVKMPKYLQDVLELEKLRNYVYRNEKFNVCGDFFIELNSGEICKDYKGKQFDTKFNLPFAKKLFVLFYKTGQIQKALTVFIMIYDNFAFYDSTEREDFANSIEFFNELWNHVMINIGPELKKPQYFLRTYLKFSNLDDLAKMFIFFELYKMKTNYTNFFYKGYYRMKIIDDGKTYGIDTYRMFHFVRRTFSNFPEASAQFIEIIDNVQSLISESQKSCIISKCKDCDRFKIPNYL